MFVAPDPTAEYRDGDIEKFFGCMSSTVSPAESVEDRAIDFADRYWESSFGQSDPITTAETHDLMIAFAQAEIERQTPAIIERFVEEVEEIVESRDFCPECLGRCTYPHVMQTVKARRSGGEGK